MGPNEKNRRRKKMEKGEKLETKPEKKRVTK